MPKNRPRFCCFSRISFCHFLPVSMFYPFHFPFLGNDEPKKVKIFLIFFQKVFTNRFFCVIL